MLAIDIKDVKKTYHEKGQVKEALKGINLSIPKGSFYGILGPNGAGKSTLINILAGITVKSSGSISLNGFDIDKDPIKAKYLLGVVPQELVLDPFFTVRETIMNYCGYYDVKDAKARTNEIIDALYLSDKADARPRSLSGGMRRRLLIAKALVHRPEILILDEPSAGVDVSLRNQLWDYVKQLNKAGTTIILTTHYLEEAEELCDHIAVINHGEIIACDKTQDLIHILDYKEITVKFNQKLETLPEELTKYNSTLNSDGTISIKYKMSESPMDKIFHSLSGLGISIIDITTKQSDLEETFSYLVNKSDK